MNFQAIDCLYGHFLERKILESVIFPLFVFSPNFLRVSHRWLLKAPLPMIKNWWRIFFSNRSENIDRWHFRVKVTWRKAPLKCLPLRFISETTNFCDLLEMKKNFFLCGGLNTIYHASKLLQINTVWSIFPLCRFSKILYWPLKQNKVEITKICRMFLDSFHLMWSFIFKTICFKSYFGVFCPPAYKLEKTICAKSILKSFFYCFHFFIHTFQSENVFKCLKSTKMKKLQAISTHVIICWS